MSDSAQDVAADAVAPEANGEKPGEVSGLTTVEKQSLAQVQGGLTLTYKILSPMLQKLPKESLESYVVNRPKLGDMNNPAAQFTHQFAGVMLNLLHIIDQHAALIDAARSNSTKEPVATVDMVKVESSNIDAVGYLKESSVVFITFKDGTTYKYADVPEEIYIAMGNADSVGKYYHANIKGTYEAESLGQLDQAAKVT